MYVALVGNNKNSDVQLLQKGDLVKVIEGELKVCINTHTHTYIYIFPLVCIKFIYLSM